MSESLWFAGPFVRFSEYVEEMETILSIGIEGIIYVSQIPQLADVVYAEDALTITEERHNKWLAERAETIKRAEFSAAEIASGFSTEYGHAVISLWGALEFLVDDILLEWLANEPDVFKREEVSKIRVPVSEWEYMEKEDKIALILRELEISLKATQKAGVSRFETLLQVIGLSGEVKDEIRRDIFELYQLRNLLAHRRGIVDQHFLRACPWMQERLKVGDRILISDQDYKQYRMAVVKYVTCVTDRALISHGLAPLSPGIEDLAVSK